MSKSKGKIEYKNPYSEILQEFFKIHPYCKNIFVNFLLRHNVNLEDISYKMIFMSLLYFFKYSDDPDLILDSLVTTRMEA